MNPNPAQPWESLFPPLKPGELGSSLKLRLMRKHGEPLLLLPAQKSAADAALALYPAQSWKAKLARNGLAWLQRLGAMPGTSPVDLAVAKDSAFAQFLVPAGSSSDDLCLAMLLGNPNTAGRRFVLLIFDAAGNPVRVVKAGVGSGRAAELIRSEIAFLKAISPEAVSAPALLDTFAAGEINALALEYVPGTAPAVDDLTGLAGLLGGWLNRERVVRFGDLPAAQRLVRGARRDEPMQEALTKLKAVQFCAAIHHGDFAPWNIRVEPGTNRWRVLDWERGELMGPPAWDWFHYVLQPQVLVRRAGPEAVLEHFERFCSTPAFVRYVAEAGIQSNVDLLLLGYAIHCRDITRQTEGMPTIERLVDLLLRRNGICR